MKRGGCGDEVGEYGSKSDKSTGRFPLVGMVYSSKLVRACVGNRREARRGRVEMTSPLVTACKESPELPNQRGRAIRNALVLSTLVSLAALLCVSCGRKRAKRSTCTATAFLPPPLTRLASHGVWPRSAAQHAIRERIRTCPSHCSPRPPALGVARRPKLSDRSPRHTRHMQHGHRHTRHRNADPASSDDSDVIILDPDPHLKPRTRLRSSPAVTRNDGQPTLSASGMAATRPTRSLQRNKSSARPSLPIGVPRPPTKKKRLSPSTTTERLAAREPTPVELLAVEPPPDYRPLTPTQPRASRSSSSSTAQGSKPASAVKTAVTSTTTPSPSPPPPPPTSSQVRVQTETVATTTTTTTGRRKRPLPSACEIVQPPAQRVATASNVPSSAKRHRAAVVVPPSTPAAAAQTLLASTTLASTSSSSSALAPVRSRTHTRSSTRKSPRVLSSSPAIAAAAPSPDLTTNDQLTTLLRSTDFLSLDPTSTYGLQSSLLFQIEHVQLGPLTYEQGGRRRVPPGGGGGGAAAAGMIGARAPPPPPSGSGANKVPIPSWAKTADGREWEDDLIRRLGTRLASNHHHHHHHQTSTVDALVPLVFAADVHDLCLTRLGSNGATECYLLGRGGEYPCKTVVLQGWILDREFRERENSNVYTSEFGFSLSLCASLLTILCIFPSGALHVRKRKTGGGRQDADHPFCLQSTTEPASSQSTAPALLPPSHRRPPPPPPRRRLCTSRARSPHLATCSGTRLNSTPSENSPRSKRGPRGRVTRPYSPWARSSGSSGWSKNRGMSGIRNAGSSPLGSVSLLSLSVSSWYALGRPVTHERKATPLLAPLLARRNRRRHQSNVVAPARGRSLA